MPPPWAREGCGSSFGILVNSYEQHIYRLGLMVVKNPEGAEDILQETFLKAIANLDQFRGESRFYTWLVRIAMNDLSSLLMKASPDSGEVEREIADVAASVKRVTREEPFVEHG